MAKQRKKKKKGGKRKAKIVAAKPLSTMRINGGPLIVSPQQRFKVRYPDGHEVWYPFNHWIVQGLIKQWKKKQQSAA